MKNLFFSTLLFVGGVTFAQTHRFFYELTIRKISDTTTINMVLDIDKNMTKFYDEEFLRVDSINSIRNSNLQTNSESDQLISRKTNSSENKHYYTHGYDYFVIESTDKIGWKLEKDVKVIKNIRLQKATANFGGRSWIAWFDSKMPFQEGPYKFTGLSGLIYEIYDTELHFQYSLVRNKNLPSSYNTSHFLETHYGKKPVPISLKQYQKVKLDYYHNIVEVLKTFAEKGGSIASEFDLSSPDEIEKKRKALQKNIKEYYLPIEVNKAIPYP